MAVSFFQFQAVVLCHTLQEDGIEELVHDIHAAQPGLAVIQLEKGDVSPEKLVESVVALVAVGGRSPMANVLYQVLDAVCHPRKCVTR